MCICRYMAWTCPFLWGYPEIIRFKKLFHYIPSIIGDAPIYRNLHRHQMFLSTHVAKPHSSKLRRGTSSPLSSARFLAGEGQGLGKTWSLVKGNVQEMESLYIIYIYIHNIVYVYIYMCVCVCVKKKILLCRYIYIYIPLEIQGPT